MRTISVMMSLVIIIGSLAGCTESKEQLNGKYCYEEYAFHNLNQSTNLSPWDNSCALLEISVFVDDIIVINQSSFIGIDYYESDVIIMQFNDTSSITIEIELFTSANFYLYFINQSDYSSYIDDGIYDEIGTLSGLCINNCLFSSDVSHGNYLLIMDLS
tara:strand:- start:694 stop:1170 length:477 start_codon:yes stop_codon:yes gene_type:complete